MLPGSRLLDAGCGTGRYAAELGRRGYVVHGIDASADLIREAKRSLGADIRSVTVEVGDILAPPASPFDAILSRGVLNDIVNEEARRSVFGAFGRALRSKGVLIFDVREWEATADRKAREPLFRKSVETGRGTLTFTSVTRLDEEQHRLIVAERHTLKNDRGERSSDYQFTMQCWTYDELNTRLSAAGFGSVSCFGAYDPAVPAGATDRLVVVAQLNLM